MLKIKSRSFIKNLKQNIKKFLSFFIQSKHISTNFHQCDKVVTKQRFFLHI